MKEIDGVTLVLLSYNGRDYLEEKIRVLLEDLRVFPHHEMIIVDDHSEDGSQEVISKFAGEEGLRIILKDEHRGIPHTMNLAVEKARYDNIIFCDQRQEASHNILKKLSEPLGNDEIGAVSACISQLDKNGCTSLIRRYENFLKAAESRAGSLMGVYGPLYAMKKGCYIPIPEQIILDDLYLSLGIMASKKISLLEDCRIYDEHICSLTDYRRIRRYLRGFLQIITARDMLSKLPARQLIMLLWHKYLRLLIPVLLFLSYISTGILTMYNPAYLLPFILFTVLGILSLTPAISRMKNLFIHFARINILYILAMGEILIRRPEPG